MSETEVIALKAEVQRLRDGITFVLEKHPYESLKRRMRALLDGEYVQPEAKTLADRVHVLELENRSLERRLLLIRDRVRSALYAEETGTPPERVADAPAYTTATRDPAPSDVNALNAKSSC